MDAKDTRTTNQTFQHSSLVTCAGITANLMLKFLLELFHATKPWFQKLTIQSPETDYIHEQIM